MESTPWRFELKLIDRMTLVRYMEFRDMSCKQLADRVGCSKATIGHLRSGHTKSIRDGDWAKAIERELNAPPGSLFEGHAFRVLENAK